MNLTKHLLPICIGALLVLGISNSELHAQTREERAFREYVNPDELVTFDRNTDFARALDVINEFAQENGGKIIIDRTGTSGSVGISIPAMHWQDALDLMLNVRGLALVERADYYEIIENRSAVGSEQGATGRQQPGASVSQDGILATTQSREVRINAIFFEGNRRALQEIGVDWSTLSENIPEDIGGFVNDGTGGGGNQGQLPSTEFGGPFVQVNSKGAQNVSQNVFNALVNFGDIGNTGIEVQALFSAFEADNLGEILASPSIKVMEGQEGSIQVGQDFSIKQRDIAGNVTDQFFSVGTILNVIPQVITQGDTTFIHLTLEAERSSAQPDPVSTIINKQEASTQALLMDGETTVIAGLYRTEQSEIRRGIPILKDLPPWFFGLRYLFGYNSKDYQMSELVILVQASIEPTVPERFGRDRYASKFEILRQERNRMRNEMLRQEDESSEIIDPVDPDRESIRQENTEEVKDRDDPFAVESEAAEDKPSVNASDSLVQDPEVETEPIPLNFSETDTNETSVKESVTEEVENQEQSDNINADTDEQVETADSDSFRYFVIGGSFKNKENAEKLNRQLIADGFDSHILIREDSSTYLVTYRRFKDLQKAKAAVVDIQKYINENAWLYRIK